MSAGLMGLATPAHHGSSSQNLSRGGAGGAGGQTLPDISLVSDVTDFDADAEEEKALRRQNGGSSNPGGRYGIGKDESSLATPSFSRLMQSMGMMGRASSAIDNTEKDDGDQQDTFAKGSLRIRPSSSASSNAHSARRPLSPSSRRQLDRRRQIAGDELEDSNSSSGIMNERGTYNDGGNDARIRPPYDQMARSTAAMNGRYLQVGEASDSMNAGRNGDGGMGGLGNSENDNDDLLSVSNASLAESPGWESSGEMDKENERGQTRGKANARRLPSGGSENPALSELKDTQRVGNDNKPMTLREQQEEHNRLEKENFTLKMKIHYLQKDLQSYMDADKFELANQNNQLKLLLEQRQKENKMNRKIVLQQNKQLKQLELDRESLEAELAAAKRGNSQRAGMGDASLIRNLRDELEAMKAEKEEANHRAQEFEELAEMAVKFETEVEELKNKLEEAERSENSYRKSCEEMEGQIEVMDDMKVDFARMEDERDRALEQLEEQEDMRGRLETLEEQKESLENELTAHKTGEQVREEKAREQISRLQTEIDELRQRYSNSQENETDEIKRLREELNHQLREHEQALAQVASSWREIVLQRDERVEEAEGALSAMEEDMRNLVDDLEDKVTQCEAANRELSILAQRVEELEDTNDRVTRELAGVDMESRQRDEEDQEKRRLAQEMEDEIIALREAESQATEERNRHRKLVEDLSKQLADLEAKRRSENEARDELRAESRAQRDQVKNLQRELEDEHERWQRKIQEKEQANARLASDIDAARDRLSQRDKDVYDLQELLRSLEDDRRKIGHDHTSDRHSLEIEIDRVRRDLATAEDDLHKATIEIDRQAASLQSKQSEIEDLVTAKRELESRLAAERQDRLTMSDRLTMAQKNVKVAEAEAAACRQRVDDLEKRLIDDRRSLSTSQRQDAGRRDSIEVLQLVLSRLNKMVGANDTDTPHTVSAVKDKLLLRLRQLQQAHTDAERSIKSVENQFEHQLSTMSRELDGKKRQLDTLENSVNKMVNTKLSWKAMLERKEEELADAKRRHGDLNAELSTVKYSNSSDSEVRSLTARATSAEKRVTTLSNQLAAMQAQVAEQEGKHADATSKWEDRVKEFEKRLKAANEKVKAEKQGGKERARQLEETVRSLQDQVRQTKSRNDKLQSILSAATMRKDDSDAL